MPRTILITAGALVVTAMGAPAPGDEQDRVFGRVGPERPVVEIPAEQVHGVEPGGDAPPAGWEVLDPSHVVELVGPRTDVQPGPGVDAGDAQAAEGDAGGEELAVATAVPQQGAGGGEAEEVAPVAVGEGEQRLGAAAVESQPLGAGEDPKAGGAAWMVRTAFALGLVLALILALAWFYERATRARRGMGAVGPGVRSPAGLLEVLGRYPLGPRQSLVLLKFDRRVLLLSQTAPRGGPVVTSTLCELTDAEDVASVLMRVRDASGETMDRAFREAMERADLTTGRAVGDVEPEAPIAQPRTSMLEPRPFTSDYDPDDLRRTVGGTEQERSQLWEDLGSERAARDPIGTLRRRLEAMRGSGAG